MIMLTIHLLSSLLRQDKLETLSVSEKETREKMLFFKRELENRESNFNKIFSSASVAGGDIEKKSQRHRND